MTTLKIGIAAYEEIKARTLAIARGELTPKSGEPKIWFTSAAAVGKVLSTENRALLRTIAEQAPASIEELARASGRQKSNLSRTLKRLANYGFVRLDQGPRGRIIPRVTYDRIAVELPITRPSVRRAA